MTEQYICDDCQRVFGNKGALGFHRKTHIRENMDKVIEEALRENKISLDITVDDSLKAAIRETTVTPEEVHEELEKHLSPALIPSAFNYTPTIKVKRLLHGQGLPDIQKATPGSAAVDLYAAIDDFECIGANERLLVPTGIAIQLPEGFVAKVAPRSGMAHESGISIVNTPGIIDSDYRGEIKVNLINHSRAKFWVKRGMRIAQMLFERVPEVEIVYVDALSATARGAGGFGSSGV